MAVSEVAATSGEISKSIGEVICKTHLGLFLFFHNKKSFRASIRVAG
jgi:hypothetical protein